MTDESIDSLKEQLAALQETLAKSAEVLAPITEAETKLNSEEYQIKEAYKQQIATIAERRKAINEAKYEAQKNVNYANQQAKYIQTKIQTLEDEAAKAKAEAERKAHEAEKYAALGKRFDNAAMAAPWRERAKDHQIAAGHKIAQDRFVILADPMGLGKTLSAIITADITEKVTRDSSPEYPFLGKEVEEMIPDQFVWTKLAEESLQATDLSWPWNISPFTQGISEQSVPVIETNPTYFPFDDIEPVPPLVPNSNKKIQRQFRGKDLKENDLIPYLPYDLRTKLVERELVKKIPAHYETKITDSIEHPVGRRILYFCPAPLLRNVLEEWRKWSPHRNVTYIGDMSKAERAFVLDLTLPKLNEYVIIVNYEAWRRDLALLDKLIACDFDTIIIDEAHNVKELKSQAYKGVHRIITETNPSYIIPMTGTPILNRPQELFSILTLLNLKEWVNTPQSARDFLWRYCEEYYTDDSSAPKYKFKPGGLEQLAKKISTNFLRRTKDQAGIILPEKTIIYHELDRDDDNFPEQAKAREHMKKFATIVLNKDEGKAIQATVMIALITRLRQIETWPAGIIQIDKKTKEVILQLDVFESQKVDYIIRHDSSTNEWEGLIPDTVEDERIVVFSQFKAPLQELKKRVEQMGRTAVVLDGSTPQNLKDEIRHDFDRSVTPDRAKSKWDVLLANYKAAGVGLNLTNATQLITLDEEWNPGKREQAWDRIHRIGQTQNVTINVVRTKDTIDTWLANIIDNKQKVVDGFESAMLTASDLKEALDSGLL